MPSFYALILDRDYEAPKPLIPLHKATCSAKAPLQAETSFSPWDDFGELNRDSFKFDNPEAHPLDNTYSGTTEGAKIWALTHK